MRKILALMLAVVMCFAFAGCATEEKADYTIATDKGFSPFEFQDKDGNIVGIDMDILASIGKKDMEFDEPSKFPSIRYDLSLLADKKVLFGEFAKIIESENCENLADYTFIGSYTDDTMGDSKSVTIRFNFSSRERTLSGEEVQKSVDALIARFAAEGYSLKA